MSSPAEQRCLLLFSCFPEANTEQSYATAGGTSRYRFHSTPVEARIHIRTVGIVRLFPLANMFTDVRRSNTTSTPIVFVVLPGRSRSSLI